MKTILVADDQPMMRVLVTDMLQSHSEYRVRVAVNGSEALALARRYHPDLVLLDFSHYWVYLVGPIAGALVAVGIAFILRGRGGGQSGIEAAQGKLDEIVAENSEQPNRSSETK